MNGRARGRAGFSLTEILIAVSVIALLLALAVPSYRKARNDSKIQVARADLALLESAIRQLAWDTGRWPNRALITAPGSTEIWNLTTTTTTGLLKPHADYGSDWKGPYIRSIPLDPWGMPYFFDPDYRISNVMRVVVGSFGPNKVGRNLYDKDDIWMILK